jgi:hypothetical protein
VLTQFECPPIGTLNFRSRKALDGHQRRPQGALQRELLLHVLGSGRESLEQGESFGEMIGRFCIGIPAHGSVSRVLQIGYRAVVVPPTLKVHRQLCRNVARLDAVPFFSTLTNAPVQVLHAVLPAPAARQPPGRAHG